MDACGARAVGAVRTRDLERRRDLTHGAGGRTPLGSATRHGVAADARGSAPVEFVLVGALLTLLTVAVLQLGFAIYAHNVVQDAAVDAAYRAALADARPGDASARADDLITRAVGDGYAREVSVSHRAVAGVDSVVVTISAVLPLAGPFGLTGAMEVTAHAPRESLG